ncbi:hypothetical protein C8F04DRAFT_1191585 [Mycena alexandri]|uniref:Uncharacterized protein n=1 Tax=Mycena alexandri TaxID=1745969 RepID=A0AAD6SFW8_9AGAR|nr:hypothetical protein C8F04DRAFT_1191585 [Mycena alexandri]
MGLIERTHHTLMSRALASLSSAKLPRDMWEVLGRPAGVPPPPGSDKSTSESEEEDEADPAAEIEEEHVPEPAQNVGRPARTRRTRGDDGAFPTTRKDAAVADAHAAEARAKERRTGAKTRRVTVETVEDDEGPAVAVEEEPAPRTDPDEYEYWAFEGVWCGINQEVATRPAEGQRVQTTPTLEAPRTRCVALRFQRTGEDAKGAETALAVTEALGLVIIPRLFKNVDTGEVHSGPNVGRRLVAVTRPMALDAPHCVAEDDIQGRVVGKEKAPVNLSAAGLNSWDGFDRETYWCHCADIGKAE